MTEFFFLSILGVNPGSPALLTNRSAAKFMQKDYQGSLSDCNEALNLDANFTKALKRAAKCCIITGQFDEAKAYYENAKAGAPDDAALTEEIKAFKYTMSHIEGAERGEQSGDYRQVAFHLREILKTTTMCESLVVRYLEAMIQQKEFAKAQTYLNGQLPNFGQSMNLFIIRARLYYYQGNFELAKKHVKDVLMRDPDNLNAQNALRKINKLDNIKKEGNSLFSAGKNEEAVEKYSSALEIDPLNTTFNSTLLCNRAAAKMKMDKYDDALGDVSQAITLNPDYAKAYLRRGNIHMKLEEYEDAVRDYEQAKQLDPSTNDINNMIKNAKVSAKSAKRKDYYKILGINKESTESEVKKAYRKMALKWHPDKNSETPEQKTKAEKMFKDVSEAYTVISDPEKKRKYDMGMDLEEIESGMPGGMGGGMGGIDPTQVFQMFFGGGAPGGAGGASFFDQMGGGGMGGGMGGMPGGMGGGMPGGMGGGSGRNGGFRFHFG
mmetsp:Transcript_37973/g.43031  ORF Transcript_37973/g.43031 Transcript_37973/m.43031 type:complete len:493 (-) Transcript_37973:1698-3176(-)